MSRARLLAAPVIGAGPISFPTDQAVERAGWLTLPPGAGGPWTWQPPTRAPGGPPGFRQVAGPLPSQQVVQVIGGRPGGTRLQPGDEGDDGRGRAENHR